MRDRCQLYTRISHRLGKNHVAAGGLKVPKYLSDLLNAVYAIGETSIAATPAIIYASQAYRGGQDEANWSWHHASSRRSRSGKFSASFLL